MNRNKINFVLNILLIIVFAVVAVIGILKFPGLIPYFGMSYMLLPIGDLSTLHDWLGMTLIVLIIVHVSINWRLLWRKP